MKHKVSIAFGLIASAAVGVAVVYTIRNRERVKSKVPQYVETIKESIKDMYKSSKNKVDEVSEDVALKAARVTRNPKVNQDWVEKQWESVI